MRKIIYPKPLVAGKGIGITAPSSGVLPKHEPRLELVISQLKDQGYLIKEGKCLRGDHKHVSAPAPQRVDDFMSLWNDAELRAIIPPWGGELLIDLLSLLDFEAIAASSRPKWILGYSDTSTLLFALTLKTGIATAHGSNLMDLIQDQVFGVTQTTLNALAQNEGASFIQESYPQYQVKSIKYEENKSAAFNLKEQTCWYSLQGDVPVAMKGRLIGGCLDTLLNLVGTPFGDLNTFKRSFKEEGVVLYLENCELSPCGVARALWNMRLAGWFDELKGMVFGRSAAADANSDAALSYAEAIRSVLGPLGVPTILDADIGHRPPQMLFINGALAEVSYENGRGSIRQTLA